GQANRANPNRGEGSVSNHQLVSLNFVSEQPEPGLCGPPGCRGTEISRSSNSNVTSDLATLMLYLDHLTISGCCCSETIIYQHCT
ncbi:MAG TPA: hypothetical protein VGV87_10370, partial [Blastocatellia bacterium]|nr:hypothetical protein [Blastocatellia bacterium]